MAAQVVRAARRAAAIAVPPRFAPFGGARGIATPSGVAAASLVYCPKLFATADEHGGDGGVATRSGAAAASLVYCSKLFATADEHGGVGVFAAVPIKQGELIERGVVKRLPLDGHDSTNVFTWSEDRSVWATSTGVCSFYNAALTEPANTEMMRHFDDDTFEVYAKRDISANEQVTHSYRSIDWRRCFAPLREMRDRGTLPKLEPAAPGAAAAAVIECSKVYAAKSAAGTVGAFAAVPIREGEVFERGIARRVPLDSADCDAVFPWSADGSVSVIGSGCSLLYPAVSGGIAPNAEMRRHFDTDRFEIVALRSIAPDEALAFSYAGAAPGR